MRHPDTGALLRNGQGTLARGQTCCCVEGCCNNQLISGETVLLVELIENEPLCPWPDSEMCMDDLLSPNIWSTQSCYGIGLFGVDNYRGLILSCNNNSLNLNWDATGGCPLHPNPWIQEYGTCDPFVFIYSHQFFEDQGMTPGCDCNGGSTIPGTVVGRMKVRITISP